MFSFYGYIKPDEYRFFANESVHPAMRLPDFRSVDKAYWAGLGWHDDYSTEEAMLVDAGFQLWKRGYRWTPDTQALNLIIEEPEDNYRFIRRYFGARWAYYIAWLRHRQGASLHTERSLLKACQETEPEDWKRPLVDRQLPRHDIGSPKVSVIITTKERPTYLQNILDDLQAQEFPAWEIIVADQSPTPWAASEEIPGLTLLHTPAETGQWTGRNHACRVAKGEYLAFLDDDVRIEPRWLTQHLQTLLRWQADISTGVFVTSLGTLPPAMQYEQYASQWNANNSLMHRKVFDALGGFDTAYDGKRWGDHAFGARAYRQGYVIVSTPYPLAIDQEAPTGGLRDAAGSAAFRRQGMGFQADPGVARYFAEYGGQAAFDRWCHTKLPWQGQGGWPLWSRMIAYGILSGWRKTPDLRKIADFLPTKTN